MWKSVRRIVLSAALLAGLGLIAPATIMSAVARADDPPNMQDYNTYWQVAQDPTPPDPAQDYNIYWAEVEATQQSGPQQ